MGNWRHKLFTIIVVGVSGFAFVAPCSTFAAFRRPFIHQITGTPTGSGGAIVPFSGPGGIAVDEKGDLWVGDGFGDLDEFSSVFGSPGNEFLPPRLSLARPSESEDPHPTPPHSLAISRSTGLFYFTAETSLPASLPYVEVFDSAGAFVRRWQVGSYAHVAIDNSAGSSAGSVYVSSSFQAGGTETLDKFGGEGKPVGFVNSKGEPVNLPYVKGNEITGTPAETFGGGVPGAKSPNGVVVDSQGNIYVLNNNTGPDHEAGAVDEYNSEGVFVREFIGTATPGLGKNHESGGFGGGLEGVAIDPISGHLLVGVKNSEGEGAVDEFDSSGGFLNQITEIEPSSGVHSHLRNAFELAVDSHGDLYVVGSHSAETEEHAVDVYGPGHFFPSLKVVEFGDRTPSSVVLHGSVDSEGQQLSECSFQYVSEEAFKREGFSNPAVKECDPTANELSKKPDLEAYYPVQAEIAGLLAGMTYRYRLVATTSGSLGGSEASGTLAFTTPAAPLVEATSVSDLSSTFADLRAQIDPRGADTRYLFQYVPGAHYDPAAANPYAAGATAPAENTYADVGEGGSSGNVDVSVDQEVGGLLSGTTYDFRVVAENTVEGRTEITYGPDSTFTTLLAPTQGLPDNRAYELVTPSDKGSAEDMFSTSQETGNLFNSATNGMPSTSGEDFLLHTTAALGSFPASSENAYVFRRNVNAKAWEMIPLASSSLGVQSISVGVADPVDFSRVGIADDVGSQASKSGVRSTVAVGSPGGPYSTLHSDLAELSIGEGDEHTNIVGASHDLGHVIIASKNHELGMGDEGQDPGTETLYEWNGGGECSTENSDCKVVSVSPEGSVFQCGAVAGHSDVAEEGADDAVSEDGSRVFFTAPDPYVKLDSSSPATKAATEGCWSGATKNTPQLYMRSGGKTIEISAPEEGWTPQGPVEPAAYAGASEDGSKVFFLTETELTRSDSGIHDMELYECEIVEEAGGGPKCRLTRISAGTSGESAGEVFHVPAIAASGSAVYFTAFAALAPGATSLTPPVKAEDPDPVNLYRYDTISDTTSYVAIVLTIEAPSKETGDWFEADSNAYPISLGMSWYAAPGGGDLLFPTSVELKPGYSTAGACHLPGTDGFIIGHCEELYRYNANLPVSHGEPGTVENPVCVSCDPSGNSPTSNATFSAAVNNNLSTGPVPAMSNDGSYVFFETADGLVPRAENHTLDVYEWEAQGTGGCELSRGCVHLISSGANSQPSYFLGESSAVIEGKEVEAANVFFGTHARLVPEDTDESGDVYDARVDGGFGPGISGGAECNGSECRNPPLAPIDATPVSTSFSGIGDHSIEGGTKVKSRTEQTRAQQLATALKACRNDKVRKRRSTCEKLAKKKYGVKAKTKIKKAVGSRGKRDK